jgi:delta24-sterol reductase
MTKIPFQFGKPFEYLLTHYRDIFATFVLLPISAVYGAASVLRQRIVFRLKSAPAKHDQRVEQVIRQIDAWRARDAARNFARPAPVGKR